MSEEDVREGLRAAVSDEPPLNLDPEVLVHTARQQTTRRRALVAVGTATVAIAVAAVAIPAAFDRGTGTVPAATQPVPSTSSTSSPEPTTSPSGTDTSPTYTADQLAARGEEMRGHLKAAMSTVLPAASEVVVGEFGGEAAGEFFDGQDYVNAPVTFTLDGARYSIFVTARAPGGAASGVCPSPCQDLGERDGGKVQVRTEDLGEPMITTVYHLRKNGGVVEVAAYNYDMTGVPEYLPSILLTIDQLMTLATDPELGL